MTADNFPGNNNSGVMPQMFTRGQLEELSWCSTHSFYFLHENKIVTEYFLTECSQLLLQGAHQMTESNKLFSIVHSGIIPKMHTR